MERWVVFLLFLTCNAISLMLMFSVLHSKLVVGPMVNNLHREKLFLASTSLDATAITFNVTTSATMRPMESTSTNCNTLRPKIAYSLEPWSLTRGRCNDNCVTTKEVRWSMVLFVKSAAQNAVRRELLRRTWATISYMDGARLYAVFVIGSAREPRIDYLVSEEYDRYGDLLQYVGPDDYSNITTKTLAAMQWAGDHLSGDYFYSSVDDDFQINIAELQESVDEHLKAMDEKSWPEFPIICGFRRGMDEKPMRVGAYKWVISKETYKWPDYPPYCHGGLYTTSVKVARQLHEISRSEKILFLDDVWITGILRNKLGMPNSMVVVPRIPTGLHFSGYRDKESDTVRGFMRENWDNLFKLFKDRKTLCQCVS